MRFRPDGPDIPDSLLRAQRSGELMFVVGAGISRSAGLPLFGRLAELIYERMGQALPGDPNSLATEAEIEAYHGGQYDRLIGLLEQRIVYRRADWQQPHNQLRAAVAEFVRPRRGASFAAHRDLLDLSRGADGCPRIVTTNFDTVFEKAWYRATRQRLPSSAGPGMPSVGSFDFTGVLHLHGRIDDKRLGLGSTDLVLTAPNFGEAYMRSGWASRIVYDLLRRYTLVLVGYSADDPPMRYMLEATEEGRLNFPDLKPAYAIVPDETGDVGGLRETWRAKGLSPLIYTAQDPNHAYLYETLRGWADLARDPLAWSETRITEITATPAAEADDAARAQLAYLTHEISSIRTLAQYAADPVWLDAIETDSHKLDEWAYLTWFRDRLESADAARYAVAASGSKKLKMVNAINLLLRTRDQPLAEPYASFWPLFLYAYGGTEPAVFSRGARRVPGPVTANQIHGVVEQVAPKLKIEKRFRWPGINEHEPAPANIHDLGHFQFQARDRDWQRRLQRWPEDSSAEARLIAALDRSLEEACEVAADAGLLGVNGDLMSFDIGLVHAPDDGEGLVEPNDRHGANWRLNPPDQNNDRFAPLIRLATGLWRRLEARDATAARRLARNWAERDEMIFKRMGAWAATNSDHGPAPIIEAHLKTTTRQRYWASDNNPEVVRFYCRRWNGLRPATRVAIERAILAGLDPEFIRRIARPGHRRYAKALYTTRELVRIITAGGILSDRAQQRLAAMHAAFPDLPREMPIYAHLYSPSWSGSGYSANTRVLAEVADEQLLESAEQFEQDNRIEQSDLWRVFARTEPERALRALLDAQRKGEFPAERWQPLLSLYAYPEPVERLRALPPISDVLEGLLAAPDEPLSQLATTVCSFIDQHADGTAEPHFPAILALWDKMLPIAATLEEPDDGGRPLSEEVLSHPLANLAESLISMQSNVDRKRNGGFATQFAARFEGLVALDGRPGLIARAALVRQLSFLNWLSPDWTETNLFAHLLAGDAEALALIGVVADTVAPRQGQMFNRLKASIFAALEHDTTEDRIREDLSNAVLVAAFAVIDGNLDFELTQVEARRTLTRMPNSVLATMAWSLGSLLRQEAAADPANYWNTKIKPFLREFWPNDVTARTKEVSGNLARIPGLAGAAFEDAVDVVLGLVRPIGLGEIRFALELDDEPDRIRNYPRAALKLVAALVDRGEAPPSDLAQVVTMLLDADATIAAEPAFWRLRQMQRPS